jgi:hypothetical protein
VLDFMQEKITNVQSSGGDDHVKNWNKLKLDIPK